MLGWVPACNAFGIVALRRGDDGGEAAFSSRLTGLPLVIPPETNWF